MAREVETEIKLRVAGPVAARKALLRLGATLKRPRHFEDNLLFDDSRSSLGERGEILRLRRTVEGAVLTFKSPRSEVRSVKSRRELEVPVADPDTFQEILKALGFRAVFRYQKYRETYTHGPAEIVIDETPLGTFLEIEGPVEAIHAAARALGFERRDYITDSYVGLFFAAGGKGDMVFRK